MNLPIQSMPIDRYDPWIPDHLTLGIGVSPSAFMGYSDKDCVNQVGYYDKEEKLLNACKHQGVKSYKKEGFFGGWSGCRSCQSSENVNDALKKINPFGA